MAKVLTVDYAQMAKLRDTLQAAATRSRELSRQMSGDVAALGGSWKGANHDAFVSFFEDRARWLQWYADTGGLEDNYLGAQAAWVGTAIKLYEALEAEIDAQVKRELGAGS